MYPMMYMPLAAWIRWLAEVSDRRLDFELPDRIELVVSGFVSFDICVPSIRNAVLRDGAFKLVETTVVVVRNLTPSEVSVCGHTSPRPSS